MGLMDNFALKSIRKNVDVSFWVRAEVLDFIALTQCKGVPREVDIRIYGTKKNGLDALVAAQEVANMPSVVRVVSVSKGVVHVHSYIHGTIEGDKNE